MPEGEASSSGYSYFPLIKYCAVGTDNTAPVVGDTALGTEVGRTSTTYQTEELNRTTDGVYELTRYIEFDFDEANGNLTEWGFSYDAAGPGLLFNRALFLDGSDSPEVVTKTSDYKLRIIYTLEVTLSPVTMTAGSFTVTGVGAVNGDYMLVGRAAPASANERCAAPDLHLFSTWARGGMGTLTGISSTPTSGKAAAWPNDLSAVTYTYGTSFNLNGTNGASDENVTARDAYTPGSFQRTGGLWKWGTAYANHDPLKAFLGVGAYESYNSGLQSCGAYAGYVFDLDLADEFSKDNEHTLTIGVPTVTWARGS